MKTKKITFTAEFDGVLNIFNYPEPIPVKKGDQVVFKVRFPLISKVIEVRRNNRLDFNLN